jgi:hypothetical protein
LVLHKIKVDKQSIRTILAQFAPIYRVPSFQRRFIWDEEDIRDLVDSIRRNYPIGAIIVWKPNRAFPSVPLYDTEVTPNQPQPEYVIDGQQRLTSLVLIKNYWKISRDSRPLENVGHVSYNPSLGKVERGYRGADLALILNAAMGDFNASNELQKKYTVIAKKLYEDIGARILNYEIPIYEIETIIGEGEEEIVSREMADVFTRINSAGSKIGKLEMFLSFFAGGVESDSKMRITTIWENYDKKLGLELEPFLRFVFGNMGVKQGDLTKVKSFDQALKGIKDRHIDFATSIDNAEKAVGLTAQLLEEDLGIMDVGLLPSQNTLIPIFQYFLKTLKLPIGMERENIEKWFTIASFRGVYSSSADKKIEDDLKLVSQGDGFPLTQLLNHMEQIVHLKSLLESDIVKKEWEDSYKRKNGNRYRLLLQWALRHNDADDWAGNKIIDTEVSVHHIFPQEYLEDKLTELAVEDRENLIHAFPNLTLVKPEVNSQIGATPPSEYLMNFSNEALEKHLIPNERELWKSSNYEQFLQERAKLLFGYLDSTLNP